MQNIENDINNEDNCYLKEDPMCGYGSNKCSYSKKFFKKDDLVLYGIPQYEVSSNTRHSLYINYDKIVIFQDEIIYMSHSCNPNLVIKENDHGGYSWYAYKDIAPDDMLTWNYTTIEHNISSINNCLCKSKNCVKKLRNIEQFMGEPYYEYHAKYLDQTQNHNTSKFKFKLAIVIDATTTIGIDNCIHLAKNGTYIAVISNDTEKLNKLKDDIKQINGVIRVFKCDISDKDEMTKIFSDIYYHFGQIDFVVSSTIDYCNYMDINYPCTNSKKIKKPKTKKRSISDV
jgi:hypothetical protein